MASVEQQQRPAGTRTETGFYCSTSGTYFSDKDSLAEHYKSDFHRYNLKRKVAGLPPVTKEWFEARKVQLTSAAASPHSKVWYDPLTKKKFQTQQTYQAHINSKKYQQLVRESGQPAPAPIIMIKQLADESDDANNNASGSTGTGTAVAKPSGPSGFTMKAPARRSAADAAPDGQADDESADAGDDSSGWETMSKSDDDAAADGAAEGDAQQWEEWDPCVSLFDNKLSASMEDNLQYMYKKFGFFLPDADYLADPEGLIKYLGAKLAAGKVPLYSAGDDANAKQFRSLHAVQRHMVDTNQCRMLFDGNEEEYEDYYDYSSASTDQEGANAAASSSAAADDSAAAQGKQLALALDGLNLGSSGAAGSWELSVAGQGSGSNSKVLGARELARYYKQRPKPADTRQSVIVNTIIAQYRLLGLATQTSTPPAVQQAAQRQQQNKQKRQQQLLFSRNNVNFNLPKNVTY